MCRLTAITLLYDSPFTWPCPPYDLSDQKITVKHSVVDPHHFVWDPNADLDSTYHPDADPDSDFFLCGSVSDFHPDADPYPDPSFKKDAQTLAKVLK